MEKRGREKGEWIFGIHPLREALSASSGSLDKIYMLQGHWGRALREIAALAKEKRIPISRAPREALDRLVNGKGHQGVIGRKGTFSYVPLDLLLELAAGPKPGVVAFFHHIQDPQNLGAVLRSAQAFGVKGIVLEEECSVSVTPAVVKASAGMAFKVPLARISSLVEGLQRAKDRDFSLIATTLNGKPLQKMVVKKPVALVFGAEGGGLPSRIVERCDEAVSISMEPIEYGGGGSLNLSVAAGIFFFWYTLEKALDF